MRSSAAVPALARLLWNEHGERRIPAAAALDRALSALPRGALFRVCELNPFGPIYLIPTRPFLRALARQIRALGARRVHEVAAGDGHLAGALAAVAPDLIVSASDSGAWERPQARMNAAERRRYRGRRVAGITPGRGVDRLPLGEAVRRAKPDLLLASWLPPGPLLAQVIRQPVRHVIEIGAGSGITGDISCWRFEHEFLEGTLPRLARCRLDERPAAKLHTRVTLYEGAARR